MQDDFYKEQNKLNSFEFFSAPKVPWFLKRDGFRNAQSFLHHIFMRIRPANFQEIFLEGLQIRKICGELPRGEAGLKVNITDEEGRKCFYFFNSGYAKNYPIVFFPAERLPIEKLKIFVMLPQKLTRSSLVEIIQKIPTIEFYWEKVVHVRPARSLDYLYGESDGKICFATYQYKIELSTKKVK